MMSEGNCLAPIQCNEDEITSHDTYRGLDPSSAPARKGPGSFSCRGKNQQVSLSWSEAAYVDCCLAVGGQRSLPWQVEGALGTAFSWQYEMTADGPRNVTWARRSFVPSYLGEPCLGCFWVRQWPHILQLLTSDPSP